MEVATLYGRSTPKDSFKNCHSFVEWFHQLFYNNDLNIGVIQCIHLKKH